MSDSRPAGEPQYYYTGTFYFNGPGMALGQGMSVRADQKAHADVLKLLDHELAAVRRKQERQSPGAARAARSRYATRATAPQYQIWVGKTTRYIQIAFPLPNEFFDETTIQLLRTSFRALQARRHHERSGHALPPAGR